jgi:hypothetical protein
MLNNGFNNSSTKTLLITIEFEYGSELKLGPLMCLYLHIVGIECLEVRPHNSDLIKLVCAKEAPIVKHVVKALHGSCTLFFVAQPLQYILIICEVKLKCYIQFACIIMHQTSNKHAMFNLMF